MKNIRFVLLNTVFIPGVVLAQGVTELDPIVLQGTGDAPQGPYGVFETDTATRLPVEVQRTARSVSTVTKEQTRQQGATTVENSLSYSASVATQPFGLDGRYDSFSIRGFATNATGIYRDAMRLRTYSFSGWRAEPFGLEQIDVLRGPSADLYGASQPGGLVNLKSKRPTFSNQTKIETRLDDNGSIGFGIDLDRQVSESVAFRTVFWGGKEETDFTSVDGERLYFAPSVTIEPSSDTSLTIYAQYQKDKVPDTYVLVPQAGSKDPHSGGLNFGPDFYTGIPFKNDIDTIQNFIGYEFEHDFGGLTFRSKARYANNRYKFDSSFIGAVVNRALLLGTPGADPSAVDTALLVSFDVDDEATQISFDNSIEYRFDTGAVSGTLLAGVDYYKAKVDADPNYGNAGTLFLDNHARFTPGFNPFPAVIPSFLDYDIEQTGVYLLGQADIGSRTSIQASLRHDWVKTEAEQLVLLSTTPNTYKTSQSITSGSIGISYAIQDGLNVYANASRSFDLPPVGSQKGTNAPLDVEKSNAYEVGLKYQLGERGSLGLALFNIEKTNVAVRENPALSQYTQLGKVRSRGVEIEGQADLGNSFTVIGNYTYNHTKTDSGKVFPRAAKNSAALWVTKSFDEGALEGFTFGLGARHTGKRYSDQANSIEHAPVTLVDAGITFKGENLTVGLTARNLADKQYNSYCQVPSGAGFLPNGLGQFSNICTYAEGRNIALTASYEF